MCIRDRVKIDQEGAVLYNQAVAAWKTSKSEEGALEACKLLAKINPQSSYAEKGNALVAEIEKHYATLVAEQKALQEEERRRKAAAAKSNESHDHNSGGFGMGSLGGMMGGQGGQGSGSSMQNISNMGRR